MEEKGGVEDNGKEVLEGEDWKGRRETERG